MGYHAGPEHTQCTENQYNTEENAHDAQVFLTLEVVDGDQEIDRVEIHEIQAFGSDVVMDQPERVFSVGENVRQFRNEGEEYPKAAMDKQNGFSGHDFPDGLLM